MKIEVGKRYRRRDGTVVTVDRDNGFSIWKFGYRHGRLGYFFVTEEGRWGLYPGMQEDADLVAEAKAGGQAPV